MIRNKFMHGVCFVAVVGLLAAVPFSAHATLFIGNALNPSGQGKNDKVEYVVPVIEAYNAANDPDITADITLFKKTDDDASFVFNSANGFTFWDSETNGNQITSAGDLHALSTAWFTYDGPEDLLLYSVKGGTEGFSLYEFCSGLRNLLTINGSDQQISHASFWLGEGGGNPVPEPASLLVWGLIGLVAVGVGRRFRRR